MQARRRTAVILLPWVHRERESRDRPPPSSDSGRRMIGAGGGNITLSEADIAAGCLQSARRSVSFNEGCLSSSACLTSRIDAVPAFGEEEGVTRLAGVRPALAWLRGMCSSVRARDTTAPDGLRLLLS